MINGNASKATTILQSSLLLSFLLLSGCEKPNLENGVASYLKFRDTPDGIKFTTSVQELYSGDGGSPISAQCDGGYPTAEKMIIVRMKNDYKNINRNNRIRVRNYNNGTWEGIGPGANLPQPTIGGTPRRTRLDLDLTDYFGQSDAVRVKVIIRDNDLTFINSTEGVKISGDVNNSVCGYRYKLIDVNDEGNDPKRESVSFFVKKDPSYSSPIHFNIYLIVVDDQHPDYGLPIIVDPIIKNDG